jgi:hypothetical protein
MTLHPPGLGDQRPSHGGEQLRPAAGS